MRIMEPVFRIQQIVLFCVKHLPSEMIGLVQNSFAEKDLSTAMAHFGQVEPSAG
jgi:hypothetical protein